MKTRQVVAMGIAVLSISLSVGCQSGPVQSEKGAVTAVPAQGDVITDYNDALIQLFREAPVDPELAAYATAWMNGSAFDAINAIVGGYEPYAFSGQPAGKASPEAAAAQAAHDALEYLWFFKHQKPIIDEILTYELSRIPAGDEKNNGISLGKEAARAFIQKRSGDMAQAYSYDGPPNPCPAPPAAPPGCWQPTPPENQAVDKPNWGKVQTFVIPSPVSKFAVPQGPPKLDSPEYAKLFNEVKAIGKSDSATRTPDQTRLALFWSEQAAGQRTPPGSWVAIANTLTKSRTTTLIERARLFALLGLAMADAGIDAWEVKNVYNFWRPVTAIQAAAGDGNPDTQPDPSWQSLLPAPNFQAYFSGHSDFGWAAATVIKGFFGTDALSFTATSDTLPLQTIPYTSVTKAAEDNGIARLYLGVHFNNENLDAKKAGTEIGNYVFEHALTPKKTP